MLILIGCQEIKALHRATLLKHLIKSMRNLPKGPKMFSFVNRKCHLLMIEGGVLLYVANGPSLQGACE